MNLYKDLVTLKCFSYNDLIDITKKESSAQWYIKSYLKKGYIERVRRDLYTVISMETDQPIANRFQIASVVSDDACVSYHSAFEYYGFANQVFNDVYFISNKKIRGFEYDGLKYHPILNDEDKAIVETQYNVRVTSLEQTVIDGIEDPSKVGGLEELLRCISLIPHLEKNKLLLSLKNHSKSQLYQKAGYILEAFNDELLLSDSFFEECKKNSSKSKTYLYDKKDNFILHKKWKLYAPKYIKELIAKGDIYCEAI